MQESSCQYDVTSSASCVGLMQICSWDVCSSELDLNTIRDLSGEDNIDNNIECGAIILDEKYETALSDGDRIYDCGLKETYNDWSSAVRGYNGWTSADRCSSVGDQVYYVEDIQELYNQLAELYNDEAG